MGRRPSSSALGIGPDKADQIDRVLVHSQSSCFLLPLLAGTLLSERVLLPRPRTAFVEEPWDDGGGTVNLKGSGLPGKQKPRRARVRRAQRITPKPCLRERRPGKGVSELSPHGNIHCEHCPDPAGFGPSLGCRRQRARALLPPQDPEGAGYTSNHGHQQWPLNLSRLQQKFSDPVPAWAVLEERHEGTRVEYVALHGTFLASRSPRHHTNEMRRIRSSVRVCAAEILLPTSSRRPVPGGWKAPAHAFVRRAGWRVPTVPFSATRVVSGWTRVTGFMMMRPPL